MKVYVVLGQNKNTDFEFCGVYATKKEAEKRIEELVLQLGINEEDLYIEEYEV